MNENEQLMKESIFNKLLVTRKFFNKNATINKFRLSPNGNGKTPNIIPSPEPYLNKEEIEYLHSYPEPCFDTFLLALKNNLTRDEMFCPFCGKPKSAKHRCVQATCGSKECLGKAVSQTKQNFSEEKKADIRKKHEDYYESHYGPGIKNGFQVPEIREKAGDTMEERYGVRHALQNPEIKKRAEDTTEAHYGVRNPALMGDFNERAKATFQRKYGVDNYSQTEEYKEKVRETSLREYGYEHYTQNPEVIQRNKDTREEKYGDPNYVNKEKIAQTKLEKYGDPTYSNPEKAKRTKLERYKDEFFGNPEKGKQTRITKYREENNELPNIENLTDEEVYKMACEYYSRLAYESNVRNHGGVHNLQSKELREKNFQLYVDSHVEQMEQMNWQLRGLKLLENHTVQCLECGEIYDIKEEGIKYIRSFVCPECHPYESSNSTSLFEFEVKTLLDSLKINYESNKYITLDGLRRQLDFYLPDFNIGIECDGFYWHSIFPEAPNENRITPEYHLEKTELCEKLGINLIHIFEYDWKYNKEVVIDFLEKSLGVIKNQRYKESDLKVKEIEEYETLNFIEENYLFDDKVLSNIRLGLYNKNELVTIMTFNKIKGSLYEITCFCEKLGKKVAGGFSKLVNYFEETYKPQKLVLKLNRRYFDNVKPFGFNFYKSEEPSYFYWKSSNVYDSKFFSRENQEKLLETYDPNLSEEENMFNNKYKKIYDCGQNVFIKEVKSC